MELIAVTDQWSPSGGGRERYLAELVVRVLESGGRVRVLCLHDRSGGVRDEPVEVTVVGGGRREGERRLAREILELRAVDPDRRPVLATRPQPQATHYQLHSGIYRDAYAAERESLRSAVRRLLFWPALRFNRHRMGQLAAEREILAPCSDIRLMSFTRSLRDGLSERFGVARERVSVSPPGVDPMVFKPFRDGRASRRPPSATGLRLLFVSHNFVLRGLETAVRATARCRAAGIEASLTVAGEGPVSRFRRLAARLGVAHSTQFMGPVDRQTVASLYRRCHALVLPTYYDAFSLVVLEALASGCPVVTTRRCGASELMVDGVHGRLLSHPTDVEGFAEACESLVELETWRSMHEAAIELAVGRDFRSHADNVLEWLGA